MATTLASTYRELAAPPALSRFVSCLWVHQISDASAAPSSIGAGVYDQPVFPDGCIDVVAIGDEVVVAGPASRSTAVQLAPGSVTVGVRFRPGAAPALVGVSASDLRDQNIALDDLWGRTGAGMAAAAVATPDWQERLRILVDGLAGRLDQAREPDPVGTGIASVLAARPGRSLSLVARDVGLSERQLRRRVEDAVGYSPRLLVRVLRFQRFLHAARASAPGRHLARLAADAGYADQAHLTRECRELGGLPPAALLDWEARRLAG